MKTFGVFKVSLTQEVFVKSIASSKRFLSYPAILIYLQVAPACVRRRGYNPSKRHCKWYKVNKYGSNGGRHCPRNYYLAGVYSRASCKRDRE